MVYLNKKMILQKIKNYKKNEENLNMKKINNWNWMKSNQLYSFNCI